MPTKIKKQPPYDSLVCQCGNENRWTFCDRDGQAIDKAEAWRGYYLCDACGLVVHWPSGDVVRRGQS